MSSSLPMAMFASLALASPAFWMVHEQTLSLPDAARRWAIVLGLCWAGIAVVRALAFPDPRTMLLPAHVGEPAAATETSQGPAT